MNYPFVYETFHELFLEITIFYPLFLFVTFMIVIVNGIKKSNDIDHISKQITNLSKCSYFHLKSIPAGLKPSER